MRILGARAAMATKPECRPVTRLRTNAAAYVAGLLGMELEKVTERPSCGPVANGVERTFCCWLPVSLSGCSW